MITCDGCGQLVRSWWRTVGHPGCVRALKLEKIITGRW